MEVTVEVGDNLLVDAGLGDQADVPLLYVRRKLWLKVGRFYFWILHKFYMFYRPLHYTCNNLRHWILQHFVV